MIVNSSITFAAFLQTYLDSEPTQLEALRLAMVDATDTANYWVKHSLHFPTGSRDQVLALDFLTLWQDRAETLENDIRFLMNEDLKQEAALTL